MALILVIADDLTGGSEIGGIAKLFGLRSFLVTDPGSIKPEGSGVWILDTHSRSCHPAESELVLAEKLKGLDFGQFDLVYKKVDSVLRGPVATEISFIRQLTAKKNTLLLPANPSIGRIIRDGHYFIRGIPINKTSFRDDPLYPRTSSRVEEMVTDQSEFELDKMMIPDIESIEALDELSGELDPDGLLLAGGADFFASLLRVRFLLKKEGYASKSTDSVEGTKDLYILGSHPSVRSKSEEQLAHLGAIIHYLPVDLLQGSEKISGANVWLHRLNDSLTQTNRLALAGPREIVQFEDTGLLPRVLSDIAARMISELDDPLRIFVDGGELASKLFKKLDWKKLEVLEVYGPGIVGLKSSLENKFLYVKPGSYVWPEGFFTPRKE